MEKITWDNALKNTGKFQVQLPNWIAAQWLPYCKTCNKVTFPNTRLDGQILGNCQQTLSSCSECGMGIVYDDYKWQSIESFINYKSLLNQ